MPKATEFAMSRSSVEVMSFARLRRHRSWPEGTATAVMVAITVQTSSLVPHLPAPSWSPAPGKVSLLVLRRPVGRALVPLPVGTCVVV